MWFNWSTIMIICWFGNYDPAYARNKILIDGLRAQGVEVIECQVPGSGLLVYPRLLWKYLSLKKDFDFIYCAFPVHLSIFLTLFSKKPVIVDMMISLFDTEVCDRKRYRNFDPRALFLKWLDILTVKLADLVIVDTKAHCEYFAKWRNAAQIKVVPVGVHTSEFYPTIQLTQNKKLLVQFHGSYIPLQGISKIVQAAAILRDNEDISFRLIGTGQDYAYIKKLITKLKLSNITLVSWLSIPELNQHLNEADIILGIFGDSEKSNRVVPNKVFQGAAVKKPVITKDSPAVREHFSSNELYLIENTPEAIATAIIFLQSNPVARHALAQKAYEKIVKNFNEKNIAQILLDNLQ
jgi:glycosyltransferase involved in cell wall biosynthesis